MSVTHMQTVRKAFAQTLYCSSFWHVIILFIKKRSEQISITTEWSTFRGRNSRLAASNCIALEQSLLLNVSDSSPQGKT